MNTIKTPEQIAHEILSPTIEDVGIAAPVNHSLIYRWIERAILKDRAQRAAAEAIKTPQEVADWAVKQVLGRSPRQAAIYAVEFDRAQHAAADPNEPAEPEGENSTLRLPESFAPEMRAEAVRIFDSYRDALERGNVNEIAVAAVQLAETLISGAGIVVVDSSVEMEGGAQ